MTEEEKLLRKELKNKLDIIANREPFFDKHKNEIKAIHVTDIMRILLDKDYQDIVDLQNKIRTF